MTKLWGPLGWMTLHSVSLIYPEQPSLAERQIATRFLDLFAETISCNQCKLHFKTMRAMYIMSNPDYLNSRQNFAVFVFRAHNSVNKRLDKPRPATVAECLQTLRNASSQNSLAYFRNAYLSYLTRNWNREFTGDAVIIRASVKEMIRINNEYWSPRENGIPHLIEADVVTPIEKNDMRVNASGRVISTVVGFKGGKLKLGNR
uniref:thiol oxidase n=1 Tax=viral metagenome TaxID=1070528 RepID=A0A6C0F394_9ZZZZ